MGSEEPAEKAEFERGQRKRLPSAKQREAAADAEFERNQRNKVPEAQQKEAADRNKRKKSPEKGAEESAERSVGTVDSEFERNKRNSASSAKQKANETPEQTAKRSQKKLYDAQRNQKAAEEAKLAGVTLTENAALRRQPKEEARANEPPEQTAKSRQRKLYDAQRNQKAAEEAKLAGVTLTENAALIFSDAFSSLKKLL